MPALPKNAAQFSAWKEAVRNKVVAASGRSREAFLWMLDVEDVCITYESELGKELNRAAEEEKVKFRRPLAGRQMLRLVYVYFQTKQSMALRT